MFNIPKEKTPVSLRSAIRDVGGSIWIANICLGPASDPAVAHIVERFKLAVQRIFDKYGAGAFRSDKKRAAVHEIGRATMLRLLSSPVYGVRLRCFDGDWAGFCDGGAAFTIGPDTDPLADLKEVAIILAGFVAEVSTLGIDGAEGTSLDERFVADFLIAKIAKKCGWEPMPVAAAIKETIFCAIHPSRDVILRASGMLSQERKLNEARLGCRLSRVTPEEYFLTRLYDSCIERSKGRHDEI